MVTITTEAYVLKPSDSREWLLIQSPDGTEYDVEIALLDYRYDCVPKEIEVEGHRVFCSQLCCYAGCYASEKEIEECEALIPGILEDLQLDAQKLLRKNGFQIYDPSDYDDDEELFKIRCAPAEWQYEDETEEDDEDEVEDETEDDSGDEDHGDEVNGGGKEGDKDGGGSSEPEEFAMPPKNHCLFLMEDGLCAVHKYYVEAGLDWVKHKFNICTTFPMDIRPQDRTLAFMKEFAEFAFAGVECLNPDNDLKARLGYPQIIDSMKYAIVDRISEPFWQALRQVGHDYRAGKIDIGLIYSDTDL